VSGRLAVDRHSRKKLNAVVLRRLILPRPGEEGIPGLAVFRFNASETGARRRGWDVDQVLAGWALDLAAGELWFASKMLLAVGALEFEF
jgi:hypothetical protein